MCHHVANIIQPVTSRIAVKAAFTTCENSVWTLKSLQEFHGGSKTIVVIAAVDNLPGEMYPYQVRCFFCHPSEVAHL